jgi:hypothetical protein
MYASMYIRTVEASVLTLLVNVGFFAAVKVSRLRNLVVLPCERARYVGNPKFYGQLQTWHASGRGLQ